MNEYWRWSAHETAAAVARRDVSVREVVQAALDRLAAVNPALNAVPIVLADEALREADAADRRIAAGESLPPLHGVPVTVKSNVDQRGCATSNGIPAFRDVIAADDSPVVANLRRAGAIIVGRTNVPELSVRWFTDNPLHGTTYSPWDRGVTPGGSTGGGAVAVATGIGALAHGSDSAGSVRYPAYACGVVGFKPSAGRIPSYDATARGDRPFPSQIVAVHGVLARSVDDAWRGLAAMSVGDARDPWWVPAPLDGPASGRSRPRIAVITGTGHGASAGPRDAVAAASHWLVGDGCDVEEAAPPHFEEACDLWLKIVLTSNRLRFGAIEQIGSERIIRAIKGMLDATAPLDVAGFLGALARRDTIARAWQVFFEDYDALLLPVSYREPFPLDLDQQDGAMPGVMAAQMPLLAASILGLPAMSVPTGLLDGVPTGVQIVSARFREDRCRMVAARIERHAPPLTPHTPG